MAKLEIIIDGSHLAHRTSYAFRDLQTSSGQSTGLIYGFLKILSTLNERFKSRGGDLLIFWDSKPVVKKILFPEYKAHRNHDNFSDYSAQLEVLKASLQFLGVGQATVEFEEADDIISSYTHNHKDSQKFIIYSADHDFLQLVDSRVLVLKPKMGNNPEIVYTEEKILQEFGVKPKGILFLKIFTGDSSDNIPGVPRLPKKQVIKILEQVPLDGTQTLDLIFNKLDFFDFLTGNQREKIRTFYDQSFQNFELIKLKEHLDVSIKRFDFNLELLREFFQKMEFHNFLRDLDSWIRLFSGGIK